MRDSHSFLSSAPLEVLDARGGLANAGLNEYNSLRRKVEGCDSSEPLSFLPPPSGSSPCGFSTAWAGEGSFQMTFLPPFPPP